jgi:hypothetical protein
LKFVDIDIDAMFSLFFVKQINEVGDESIEKEEKKSELASINKNACNRRLFTDDYCHAYQSS